MSNWVKDKVFANADDFIKWLDANFRQYIKDHITDNHVHHTYKPDHESYKYNNTLGLHRNMRNYHVNTNGWDDIAQHITIGKDGDIVTGRDIMVMPVSAKYYNGSTAHHPFAYEMIGNFDKGNDKFEGKQLDSAIKISRYFHKLGKGVVFHRECLINGKQPKTCPGTGIEKNWFMSLVKDAKFDSPAKPTEPKPSVTPSGNLYSVQSGDTLWGIATAHKVDVADLKKANKLTSDTIHVGDKLVIPGKAPAKEPVKASAPPKAPAPADRVLKEGMSGPDVKEMQNRLNKLFFKCGVADGKFGPATKDALKRFQSVYCNPADGIYGPKTRAVLESKTK